MTKEKISEKISETLHTSINESRLYGPDFVRIIAIFLMIFYHFSFDLNFFGFLNFDIMLNPFWWFLPRLIVFLFLFTAGWSLILSHSKQVRWKKFFKRFFQIALCASMISVSTFFLFRDRWIYFGTLHCIALSSLISVLLLKWPKLLGILGFILFVLSWLGLDIPWIKLDHAAMDNVELFPWLGAMFLGIFFAHFYSHSLLVRFERWAFFKKPIFAKLTFLAKHSLIIYMIHQPILFGIFYSIKFIFKIPN